jgi:hypothetical protein
MKTSFKSYPASKFKMKLVNATEPLEVIWSSGNSESDSFEEIDKAEAAPKDELEWDFV